MAAEKKICEDFVAITFYRFHFLQRVQPVKESSKDPIYLGVLRVARKLVYSTQVLSRNTSYLKYHR